MEPQSTRYKYEQIVAHYRNAIREGRIGGGDKLPSLRKTASQFSCALSVVMQAYQELEVTNHIQAIEKSGFFVLPAGASRVPTPEKYRHRLAVQPSMPSSYTGKIIAISNDSSIVPLGAAIPDEQLLPLGKFKRILATLANSSSRLLRQYTPPDGMPVLRRQIAQLMLSRGAAVAADNILITNGCTEALALAVRGCTEKGDTVAVESPGFFGLLTILEQYGRNVIEIPASPVDGMQVSVLELVLKGTEIKACICSPNYQNPLGSVMPLEKKKRLLELCSKYSMTLIEDDIYGECSYDNSIFPPLKQLDKSGSVIYCSSFSKTVSPGVRIGWLSGGKYHKRCAELKFAESLGGPAILQQAMAEFLATGGYNYHIRNFRKRIARQSYSIKELLVRYLPEQTKISRPGGGYFLWVELPQSVDAMELFSVALNNKIGLVPGPVFSGNHNLFTNCIRISCGSPVTEEMERGIEKLGALIGGLMK